MQGKGKAMSAKQAYEQKLEAKLNEWKAEIDKLKAKADGAEADSRLRYEKEIDDLKKRQAEARKKLEELRKASDDAWEDMKAGIDSAWSSLGDAIGKATSRFK